MKSRSILFTSLVCAGILMFTGVPQQAFADDFVIIVNSENPETALSRAAVSDLFLKKTTKWGHGAKVQPVDLKTSSAVREAFSTAILKKKISSVRSYWYQKIFSGSDVAPPQKDSDADVVAYVKANPGGIGPTKGTVGGRPSTMRESGGAMRVMAAI